MGIVSSAKGQGWRTRGEWSSVSIPDGDSFLREDKLEQAIVLVGGFQSPMGIVSSAKSSCRIISSSSMMFQSPMGIVSSAKSIAPRNAPFGSA